MSYPSPPGGAYPPPPPGYPPPGYPPPGYPPPGYPPGYPPPGYPPPGYPPGAPYGYPPPSRSLALRVFGILSICFGVVVAFLIPYPVGLMIFFGRTSVKESLEG